MGKAKKTLESENIGLNPGQITTLNVLIYRDTTTGPDLSKRSYEKCFTP